MPSLQLLRCEKKKEVTQYQYLLMGERPGESKVGDLMDGDLNGDLKGDFSCGLNLARAADNS